MYFFSRERVLEKTNCPKLQKGKATSYECVAEHDKESGFSLVSMTLKCHSDEWILDSSCTYHMCLNKGWFSSFKELDCGVVFIGNVNAYKTMGICTIQLKNHDGSIQGLDVCLQCTKFEEKCHLVRSPRILRAHNYYER